ncbi:hypothetical protein Plo01_35940 [Planobispora longispora]|uniref:Uncharacterized protein n=1 Tax=Planobispora longispora TaxID=28887 RepID=A0A8J3W610_9ACTN|nr:hypothetical protein GCM10020093_063590 [Planobispora longispora]GIH77165.1 hypothetical protein Plo01_35940 [Planobispora longispora]
MLRGRDALAALVLADAPLGDSGEIRDLSLSDAVLGEEADHPSEITTLAHAFHVLTCENSLKYLSHSLLIHSHGGVPFPW